MMTVHIGDLKTRAERAQRTFEEGRAKLYRSDGSQIYSDQEHEERLRTLRSERNRALAQVEEELREAFQQTNTEISALEDADPLELLTGAELEAANQKRPFALDVVETLVDTGALVSRLEAALTGGNRPTIFAYRMAGLRRRAALLSGRRESAASTGHPGAASQISGTTELDDVLDRMREHLDGGRTAAAMEGARGRLEALADIEQLVYFSRNETTSVYNPNYAVPSLGR